jgi:hypothetical protein
MVLQLPLVIRLQFRLGAGKKGAVRIINEMQGQAGLAAYNAGEGAVAACGCVPAYPETRGYVARILALLRGAGDTTGLDSGLAVRLVK